MTHHLAAITAFWLGAVARACALLAFSEFVFFNEGPVQSLLAQPDPASAALHLGELLAFYLLPGALLLVLEPAMTTWPRVILAGAFIGWSIEAAVVPAAYENVPFSYAWTSITWHALIDVALGWVLLRRALFDARIEQAICAVLLMGALTAAWSTWVWTALPLDLTGFMLVMTVVTVLLIAGYGLPQVAARLTSAPPGRVATGSVIALNLTAWAAWGLLVPIPAAGLALVALVNGWLLRRAAPGPAGPLGPTPRNGASRLGWLLLALPSGVATFWAIDTLDLGPTLGDLLVPLVAWGGLPIYGWALWRAAARR